jgi:hypothetical protein
MNIREISKPVTAKSLNESLAKKFGTKINVESFTLEQLQDARNRIRTKLSQVETNESFDSVHNDEGYQKSKLFLDVLNAAIAERGDVTEAKKAKPDYIDIDGDGDKKEPMKKAVKDKKKKAVKEGREDEAELVMAAKDMVDRVTGWMEDTAEMQTESMLELADAIRDEMGQEQAESFTSSVKPALEQLYASMESTREALTQGVGMLTGEAAPATDMPGEDLADLGDMEPSVSDEELPAEDEVGGEADDFGAAPAAAGGDEEAGRAKRESVERKTKKKVAEGSRKLAALLSKKK